MALVIDIEILLEKNLNAKYSFLKIQKSKIEYTTRLIPMSTIKAIYCNFMGKADTFTFSTSILSSLWTITGEERKLKLNGKKRRRQKRRRNGGSKKSLELFFDMEGLLIT